MQSEYAADVREAVGESVTAIYEQFKDEQSKAFASARAEVINSNKLLISKVNAAANGAKQAAEYASATAEHIRRIEDWKELLFYLSPAVVIVDIIVRLIVYFSG
ncbi:MAG: hypothetical protein IJ595_10670 [Oscillospiraceae bacterium]|nr:hypothetical protein [Oscillospiraceae bacterium]